MRPFWVVLGIVLASTIAIVGCNLIPVTSSPTQSPVPATFTVTPGIGSISVSATDGMKMVFVPAGEFEMGSKFGLKDEQPAHIVYLDAFWIDQTEVDNSQYNRCVQSGKCREPLVKTYYSDPSFSDHPVVFVSWKDAKDYCTWAGRRLPTEAEWEKAASWDPVKNEKRIYPWGNDFDCKKGNFVGSSCDGYEETSPIGIIPEGASPYGALDMSGNVWEWVNDAFIETDPYGKIENYYANSPSSNPQGVDPSITEYRVMRGGAWKFNAGLGRVTYRLWFGLDDYYDFVGFRCAISG
jgi:formylglycine-generating enzyme required for sulfatase activity